MCVLSVGIGQPRTGLEPNRQRRGGASADAARLAQKRQTEALAAATVEYRRLNPYATGDKLAVSGEVNPMIAAAISADPQWFWHGPDA
jgi:hypothetical protein